MSFRNKKFLEFTLSVVISSGVEKARSTKREFII